MADLKNEFSWSKSRDETFRECPRRYFFRYYGTWGGWDVRADERTRKLYTLKQLQSRHVWAGSKVHECIKTALQNLRRGIEPMTEGEAVETTLAVMREEFSNSRRGGYWDDPKSCGLFEHEYGIRLADSKWKETADHVAACLGTFYGSETYGLIRGLPAEQWLEVEEFSSFRLDDVKVFVVLDFSFRDGDQVAIYDWKTGRSVTRRNERQLACYSFYAIEKWGVRPDQVRTVEFNLASGRQHEHRLSGTDLDSIRQYIGGSMRDMRFLLEDPQANVAREDRFLFAENDRACRFCNFRRVCPRWS